MIHYDELVCRDCKESLHLDYMNPETGILELSCESCGRCHEYDVSENLLYVV